MPDDPSKKTSGSAAASSAKGSLPAKSRSARRYPFIASAEVTELRSGTRVAARTSELGPGGCYIDTLNPFPEGTRVRVQLLRDKGAFETLARVIYVHAGFGMGVVFDEMTPDQRSALEGWLAEFVIESGPAS